MMPSVRFEWQIMKVKIIITPKKAVLDPQGQAVLNALEHMGYDGVKDVHVGRFLELELSGDKTSMESRIEDACHRFLSNPVIEDYRVEWEE